MDVSLYRGLVIVSLTLCVCYTVHSFWTGSANSCHHLYTFFHQQPNCDDAISFSSNTSSHWFLQSDYLQMVFGVYLAAEEQLQRESVPPDCGSSFRSSFYFQSWEQVLHVQYVFYLVKKTNKQKKNSSTDCHKVTNTEALDGVLCVCVCVCARTRQTWSQKVWCETLSCSCQKISPTPPEIADWWYFRSSYIITSGCLSGIRKSGMCVDVEIRKSDKIVMQWAYKYPASAINKLAQ